MSDDPSNKPSWAHRLNVGAAGFYAGVIKTVTGAGIAVDLLNKGLNAIGVATGEKPVGGSVWMNDVASTAYHGYNRAMGITIAKPVDATDRVIHSVADLAGQIIVPAAGSIAKPSVVVAELKDLAMTTKNAFTYARSTGNAVNQIAGNAADDMMNATASRIRSAAGSLYGERSDLRLQASFAAAASGAIVAGLPPDRAPSVAAASTLQNRPSLSL